MDRTFKGTTGWYDRCRIWCSMIWWADGRSVTLWEWRCNGPILVTRLIKLQISPVWIQARAYWYMWERWNISSLFCIMVVCRHATTAKEVLFFSKPNESTAEGEQRCWRSKSRNYVNSSVHATSHYHAHFIIFAPQANLSLQRPQECDPQSKSSITQAHALHAKLLHIKYDIFLSFLALSWKWTETDVERWKTNYSKYPWAIVAVRSFYFVQPRTGRDHTTSPQKYSVSE